MDFDEFEPKEEDLFVRRLVPVKNKDLYKKCMIDFITAPSYEKLKKLDYFTFEEHIAIFDIDGKTVDIGGLPINILNEEYRGWDYRYVEDKDLKYRKEPQKCAEYEILVEHVERFAQRPATDTLMDYVEVWKKVKESNAQTAKIKAIEQHMEELKKSSGTDWQDTYLQELLELHRQWRVQRMINMQLGITEEHLAFLEQEHKRVDKLWDRELKSIMKSI